MDTHVHDPEKTLSPRELTGDTDHSFPCEISTARLERRQHGRFPPIDVLFSFRWERKVPNTRKGAEEKEEETSRNEEEQTDTKTRGGGGRKTADATQVQGCPPPGEKKEPAAPGESRKRAVRQRSGVPGIKKTRGVLRFSGSKPEEETKLLTAATPEERGRPEAQERKKKNLLFSCRQSAESAGEDSRAVREERFVFELRLGNFERGRRPPVREFFFARASDSASQPAGRRRARGFC